MLYVLIFINKFSWLLFVCSQFTTNHFKLISVDWIFSLPPFHIVLPFMRFFNSVRVFCSDRWNCLVSPSPHIRRRVESRYAYPLKNNVFIVEEDSNWTAMPWTYLLLSMPTTFERTKRFRMLLQLIRCALPQPMKTVSKKKLREMANRKTQQAHRKNTRYPSTPSAPQKKKQNIKCSTILKISKIELEHILCWIEK